MKIPNVSIRTHGLPLTVASEMKVANGGGRLVHARERVGQNPDVIVQGDLNVEDVIVVNRAH